MTNRTRVLVYGSILALFVLAGLARLLIDGFGAAVTSLTVMSLCLGAIVLLVFYEVGLSEDKARAEEEAARRERSAGPVHHEPQPPSPQRRPS